MLMEPCRGLGGKPQEEFPAEIPGRQAGAGREQTQGRGREGRRPWDGGGPRVGGTVPRRSDNTGAAAPSRSGDPRAPRGETPGT